MMSLRRSRRRLGANIGYSATWPPAWVENQLFGNTLSGVPRAPPSSNKCTRTPAASSRAAAALTSA